MQFENQWQVVVDALPPDAVALCADLGHPAIEVGVDRRPVGVEGRAELRECNCVRIGWEPGRRARRGVAGRAVAAGAGRRRRRAVRRAPSGVLVAGATVAGVEPPARPPVAVASSLPRVPPRRSRRGRAPRAPVPSSRTGRRAFRTCPDPDGSVSVGRAGEPGIVGIAGGDRCRRGGGPARRTEPCRRRKAVSASAALHRGSLPRGAGRPAASPAVPVCPMHCGGAGTLPDGRGESGRCLRSTGQRSRIRLGRHPRPGGRRGREHGRRHNTGGLVSGCRAARR